MTHPFVVARRLLPLSLRGTTVPKQSCRAGDCRITLKGRATKREVPDKSGNYKNLGRSEVVCA